MAREIDLNADLGESFGPWVMGNDAALLDIVTSANVACGGHAGDPMTMVDTLVLARERGVAVGAHPGFEDKQGFGRRRIPLTMTEVERLVATQVGALTGAAALAGHPVSYVKPHGALANWAAADEKVAAAVLRAVQALSPRLPILAISGTALHRAAEAANHPAFAEIFADRGYTDTGQLVPRSDPGALIHDAAIAAARILEVLDTGEMATARGGRVSLAAQSICVHGDGPEALALAAGVRTALEGAGVTLRAFVG